VLTRAAAYSAGVSRDKWRYHNILTLCAGAGGSQKELNYQLHMMGRLAEAIFVRELTDPNTGILRGQFKPADSNGTGREVMSNANGANASHLLLHSGAGSAAGDAGFAVCNLPFIGNIIENDAAGTTQGVHYTSPSLMLLVPCTSEGTNAFGVPGSARYFRLLPGPNNLRPSSMVDLREHLSGGVPSEQTASVLASALRELRPPARTIPSLQKEISLLQGAGGGAAAPPEPEWECGSCTLMNPGQALACGACNAGASGALITVGSQD
jgi:hypothetical protein